MMTPLLQSDDLASWSDKSAVLHVSEFQNHTRQHLEEVNTHGVPLRKAAEEICEHSRRVLNYVFGRLSPDEFEELTDLFMDTAEKIIEASKTVTQVDDLSWIQAYARHIYQRTGIIATTSIKAGMEPAQAQAAAAH